MHHLSEPHIAPLTAFVESIRSERKLDREIPFFDPFDAGIRARALFLLEAPGPGAVASGFISRDNDDRSAEKTFLLQREAGLARQTVVQWNIVPWFLGDEQGRIRSAQDSDLLAAEPYIQRLLDLLPDLRVIVLVGGKAQRAFSRLRSPPGIPILSSWHPSPRVFARWKDAGDRILAVWREAARLVHEMGPPEGQGGK